MEQDILTATEFGPTREDLEEYEAFARMTSAYRGEGMSFEDDGSP